MGQKVNPIGFRLGVYRQWDARWFADKEYTKLLHEDLAMRRLIASRLRNAGVDRIETERSANQLTVIIQTAKPGIVIGKQGASVDALRDELERISGKKVRVTIHEIKTPELDARLVAENVASQLEKRIAFRRALKQTVMRSMRAGAKGVKLEVSGRLGGAEMSRREWDRDGRVPLHTLRANIDFGRAEARTTFGRIGVTCWIYKGDYVTATGEPVMIGGPGREVVEAARPAAAIERERRPLAAPAVPDHEEVPAALAGAGGGGGLDVETDLAGPSGADAAEEQRAEADLDLEATEPEIPEIDEELPDLGVVPEADAKVEKLPAKKPAARRRPAPAKKPAPGAEPEAEAEED
jgi:small subunit ribosomal protein S3